MNERRSLSEYQEFAPGPILSRDVVCLWSQRISGEGDGHVQPILPDGCVDIIWIDDRPAGVVGPMTRPVFCRLAPGTQIIGVRFSPGVAAGWLRVPAHELTDLEIPLRETWGETADKLADRLGELRPLESKLNALRTALESHRHVVETDLLTATAVNWLAHHPAGEVQRFAEAVGVTPRHLHRLFCAAVGYGPKVFQRIVRFQRLLHLASRTGAAADTLALLAFEAGYADQAHMTREFRQFTENTPAVFLPQARSALAMSDLFKT